MARRNAVDVQGITFGVEIECSVPVGIPMTIGSYHSGVQVPGMPDGWTAESDGSIHVGAGRQGVEIVSPVLKGDDGIRQVLEVIGWLRVHGAAVNASCGFHVHVGVQGMADAQVGRIVRIVARHEAALYAVTGTRTREEGHYCMPIKDRYADTFNSPQPARDPEQMAEFKQAFANRVGRYRMLNITNHFRGRRPTLEFRVFSGTLKPVKAVAFIRIAVGLVHKALTMTRAAKWDAKQKALQGGKGPGQQAVKVLLNELWNPSWNGGGAGRTPEGPYGVIGEGITTEKCKAEAMRLAFKYDSRTNETAV